MRPRREVVAHHGLVGGERDSAARKRTYLPCVSPATIKRPQSVFNEGALSSERRPKRFQKGEDPGFMACGSSRRGGCSRKHPRSALLQTYCSTTSACGSDRDAVGVKNAKSLTPLKVDLQSHADLHRGFSLVPLLVRDPCGRQDLNL